MTTSLDWRRSCAGVNGKAVEMAAAACADSGFPVTDPVEVSPCSDVAASASAATIATPHTANARRGRAEQARASRSVIPARAPADLTALVPAVNQTRPGPAPCVFSSTRRVVDHRRWQRMWLDGGDLCKSKPLRSPRQIHRAAGWEASQRDLSTRIQGPLLSAASSSADDLPGVDRMGGRMRSWPRSTRLPSSWPRRSLGRQTILRYGHGRGR